MTSPLDPAQDPDRYDPDRYDPDREVVLPAALDPALDPDRYDPAAPASAADQDRSLTDLLGAGAFVDKTSPYLFLVGLVSIAVFLGLVALVFSNLSPR